jgi:hypothetical protein
LIQLHSNTKPDDLIPQGKTGQVGEFFSELLAPLFMSAGSSMRLAALHQLAARRSLQTLA